MRPLQSATPAKYQRAFTQRVKAARIAASKEAPEMAALLGVPRDTYYRYESRTLLPLHLIEKFCRLTGEDIDWLVTGKRRSDSLRLGSEPPADAGTAADASR